MLSFGFRDGEEQRSYGSQPLPPTARNFDLSAVRRLGLIAALDQAIKHLTRADLDGFWIHFDVDVLDDAIMSAVKYHLPDGFSWEDLTTVLRTATASDRAVGMEVTIFDPTLDPTRALAHALVDTLAQGLSC